MHFSGFAEKCPAPQPRHGIPSAPSPFRETTIVRARVVWDWNPCPLDGKKVTVEIDENERWTTKIVTTLLRFETSLVEERDESHREYFTRYKQTDRQTYPSFEKLYGGDFRPLRRISPNSECQFFAIRALIN